MFYIPMILDDLYYEKKRLEEEKKEKKAKKVDLKKAKRFRKVQRERS